MRHTITTEQEFVSFMELGVPIMGGYVDDVFKACDLSCLEALKGKVYHSWAENFRHHWLPQGYYWVEVE